MAQFGKIRSYDSSKEAGTISPEAGGDALAFRKNDLQQQAQVPLVDQRYRYETSSADGGRMRAVNLCQADENQVRQDQARQQQG